jgi:hypothetical protein
MSGGAGGPIAARELAPVHLKRLSSGQVVARHCPTWRLRRPTGQVGRPPVREREASCQNLFREIVSASEFGWQRGRHWLCVRKSC